MKVRQKQTPSTATSFKTIGFGKKRDHGELNISGTKIHLQKQSFKYYPNENQKRTSSHDHHHIDIKKTLVCHQ